MATATFFVLIRSNVSRSAASGQAAPATEPGQPANILDSFEVALTKAQERTGVNVTARWVAQGAYDYLLLVEIDNAKWPGDPLEGGGPPSPHQIAIGFGAALAQNAAVTTETVPVFLLADDIRQVVAHSCG